MSLIEDACDNFGKEKKPSPKSNNLIPILKPKSAKK